MLDGMYCDKCGVTLDHLMLLAVMVDLGGAKVSPDPNTCNDGGEHHFARPAPVIEEADDAV